MLMFNLETETFSVGVMRWLAIIPNKITRIQIIVTITRSTNDSRLLVSQMTSAKELTSFSGDPLEWLRFKQAFELTSNLGRYLKEENMAQLHQAFIERLKAIH